MGKGEIACYEQFLLFPPCFQKACFPGASRGAIVWEWVKRKMLSFHFKFVQKDRQMNGQTDRQTDNSKTHIPDFSIARA